MLIITVLYKKKKKKKKIVALIPSFMKTPHSLKISEGAYTMTEVRPGLSLCHQ
jgi:hypothetical protein